MAIINELLEYQQVDAELRKIEQEVSASEERKKYMVAKKFMESAPEKLDVQDKRAVELRRAAQGLTARYMEIKDAISEYAKVDEHVDDGGDVTFYKRSAQSLSDSLRALKGELDKLIAEIKAAAEEYDKLKKQTIAMQNQYKEYKGKYAKIKEARAPEMEKINAKLEQIAKAIPDEIIAKYKQKRKERIFPILVPLTGDSCICGMSFAIAQQSRLSGGNVIECEHCHRFIYKK
ncbi:MAG: hypothetical protein J6C93_06820 [Clostridia bacterium]|nr:hypothetical protein [Clostridia bacterium]